MANEKQMDLIDRHALGIGRCDPDAFPLQNRGYCAGWNGVINLLEQAPRVDAVPVVRCKDCKHYKPQNQGAHRNCTTPYCMRMVAVKVSPDDFCSYGERREGE
jgi:hypothetical protein